MRGEGQSAGSNKTRLNLGDGQSATSPAERMSVGLLTYADRIEASLTILSGLRRSIKGVPVGVTDPIAAAIRELERSLSALDNCVGEAIRTERSK